MLCKFLLTQHCSQGVSNLPAFVQDMKPLEMALFCNRSIAVKDSYATLSCVDDFNHAFTTKGICSVFNAAKFASTYKMEPFAQLFGQIFR